MTLIDSYDRLVALLDSWKVWDDALDELRSDIHSIDFDNVARAICVLDASARATLRQVEVTIVS